MSAWDVGMLPFARNAATQFISPTKTPEYLAAGLPVVSTAIRDVVRPYGESGLVRIADEPRAFVQAIQDALSDDLAAHQSRADAFLRGNSWDLTAEALATHIAAAIDNRHMAAGASQLASGLSAASSQMHAHRRAPSSPAAK